MKRHDREGRVNYSIQCLECLPLKRSRQTADGKYIPEDRVVGRIDTETGVITRE